MPESRQRQTILGRSQEGQLLVVQPFRSGLPKNTKTEPLVGQPYLSALDRRLCGWEGLDVTVPIIKLPTEILLQLFEYVAEDHGRKKGLWSISLTCKRFHSLVQPLLWSHVTLGSDQQAVRWISQLSDTPAGLCRRLSLSPTSRCPLGFTEMSAIVQKFLQTKRFDLSCISSVDWEPEWRRRRCRETERDEAALPPMGQAGSAAFSELHITNFQHGSPYALRNFLHWSTGLKVFTIDELAMCGYPWEELLTMTNYYTWTYKLIKDVLSGHYSTLRELRIGQIGPEDLSDFSIHEFTALEILQVCYDGTPSPEQACHNWVTRSLKKLVIECTMNDSQHGKVSIFDDEISRWLKDFAECTIARKQVADVAIAEIEVLCYKLEEEWYGFVEEDMVIFQKTEDAINQLGLSAVFRH